MKRLNFRFIIKFLVFNTLLLATLYFVFTNLKIDSVSLVLPKDIFLFVLSLTSFFVFYLILSFAWVDCLQLYSRFIITNLNTLSFWSSQIFKYLPSSLFIISFRIYYSTKQKIPTSIALKATLFESVALIYSSFCVFVLFRYSILLYILLASVYIISVYIALRENILSTFAKKIPLFKKLILFETENLFIFIRIFILQNIAWVFCGLALYLFSISLGNAPSDIGTVIYAQSISYCVSILAVFLPGGIGLKEYFLSLSGIDINTILNWRFVTILFDLIFSTIGIMLLFKTRSSNDSAIIK